MKLYKLTNEFDKTTNNTSWGVNVTHKAPCRGKTLCTDQVIHAYKDPRLAVIFNPIHADFRNPHLWEAKGRVVADDSMKVGCKSLTTTKQIPLPEITITQKLAFGILCSLEVYKEDKFVAWAKAWLDGENRNPDVARAAYAADAAYTDAAYTAARAAADAAAYAAAAYAAYAANAAARAATGKIDFVKLIDKAMKVK